MLFKGLIRSNEYLDVNKTKELVLLSGILLFNHLDQGSQTQTDSRAARDSKQNLAGRIEKVKKYSENFVF